MDKIHFGKYENSETLTFSEKERETLRTESHMWKEL